MNTPQSSAIETYVCKTCQKECFAFGSEDICQSCQETEIDVIDQKEKLIFECHSLAHQSIDSIGEHEIESGLDNLLKQWKMLPLAGEQEKSLWNKFNSIRIQYFSAKSRRDKNDASNDAQHQAQSMDTGQDDLSEVIAAKEKLIFECQSISNQPAHLLDEPDAERRLQNLMAQWRLLPATGDHEKRLWNQFNAPRTNYFNNKARRYAAESSQSTSDNAANSVAHRRPVEQTQPTYRPHQIHPQDKLQYEQNRKKKAQLLEQAKALENSSDWKETSHTMKSLMLDWKNIGVLGRDLDSVLWEAFLRSQQHFFDRLKESLRLQDLERQSHVLAKEHLIVQCQEVATSTDWDLASNKMNDLLEEWKNVPSTGREREEELWERFNSSRLRFFAAKKARFEREAPDFDERLTQKEALITQTIELVQSDNWSVTGRALQVVFDQWKEIGHTGPYESELWGRFHDARQQFFDRRTTHFERQALQQEDHRQKKRELICQAWNYSTSTDWQSTAGKMRELLAQWKEIGWAGHDHDAALWNDFHAARQTFYDNMTAYNAAQQWNEFSEETGARPIS